MMGDKNRSDNHGVSSFALYFLVASIIIFGIVTFHFLAGGNVQTGYSNFATALSGLTLPLIGIGAALITYLAFRMQYEANIKIQKQIQLQERQFKLQQFESQFYELLRLHKENVNEMMIQGYVFEGINKIEREIIGRKIFVTNITEFLSIVKCIKKYSGEVTYIRIEEKEIISLAYNIFFFGLDSVRRQIDNNKHPCTGDSLILEEDFKFYRGIMEILKAIRNNHSKGGSKSFDISCLGVKFSATVKNKMNINIKYKPYTGHLSRYGHYYRNLILIVKHVVDNKELGLTYGKKRGYLRILRAQLTSHEQFLLFLNWYSEIGSQWEEESVGGNKFFTDYRMIHNINIIENNTLDWEAIIRQEFTEFKDFKYLNENDKELFEVIKGITSTQEKKTE